MLIIDKHKDYYDYYSHIYGIDKKVVFDRRGSTKMSDMQILNLTDFERNFNRQRFDDEAYIVLEIGTIQYLMKLFNITRTTKKGYYDNDVYSYDIEIIRKFHDHKNRYGSPISIRGVNLRFWFSWEKESIIKNRIATEAYEEIIHKEINSVDLPVLADTPITSLIDGFFIWKEIQNYISSLNNDINTDTTMSNEEKAEQYGFDRKTSFRNPTK